MVFTVGINHLQQAAQCVQKEVIFEAIPATAKLFNVTETKYLNKIKILNKKKLTLTHS